MIPKILHLCWLSNDTFPPLIQKCIDSWKKVLPDYEIMVWNRERIDINKIIWMKEAYDNKKYAFAADYIRFYALYHYGGIYLDSDVEMLKSFNPLLKRPYFLGYETGGDIEAAVMGAERGALWIKECLDYYKDRHFVREDNSFDMKPVPLLVNKVKQKYDLEILPCDYFSPKYYFMKSVRITDNTFCIHHFDMNWVKKNSLKNIIKMNTHRLIFMCFGHKLHNKFVNVIRNSKK